MAQEYDAFEREYRERIAHGIATLDSRWSVTGYHGHETRNGVSWIATLRWGRIAVAHLEDAGNGGAVRVDWIDRSLRDRWERVFNADIAAVFGDGYVIETAIETLLQRAGL